MWFAAGPVFDLHHHHGKSSVRRYKKQTWCWCWTRTFVTVYLHTAWVTTGSASSTFLACCAAVVEVPVHDMLKQQKHGLSQISVCPPASLGFHGHPRSESEPAGVLPLCLLQNRLQPAGFQSLNTLPSWVYPQIFWWSLIYLYRQSFLLFSRPFCVSVVSYHISDTFPCEKYSSPGTRTLIGLQFYSWKWGFSSSVETCFLYQAVKVFPVWTQQNLWHHNTGTILHCHHSTLVSLL